MRHSFQSERNERFIFPGSRSRQTTGRVAGAVARPGSHRSVRAQLRHTARQVTGWLIRSAIRWCNVDTVPGSCAPAMFPSNGSMTWHLLPSPGSERDPTTIIFRGSITRPGHWLSTLRSLGCPRTTQDSLPAAGRSTGRDWLPAGFQRQVSELFPYISSSLLKRPGARTFLHSSCQRCGGTAWR